jgi:hypothetical protein
MKEGTFRRFQNTSLAVNRQTEKLEAVCRLRKKQTCLGQYRPHQKADQRTEG